MGTICLAAPEEPTSYIKKLRKEKNIKRMHIGLRMLVNLKNEKRINANTVKIQIKREKER